MATKALSERDEELLRATAAAIKKQVPMTVQRALGDYVPRTIEEQIGPLRKGVNELHARERGMHLALVELESRLLTQIEFLHNLINGIPPDE